MADSSPVTSFLADLKMPMADPLPAQMRELSAQWRRLGGCGHVATAFVVELLAKFVTDVTRHNNAALFCIRSLHLARHVAPHGSRPRHVSLPPDRYLGSTSRCAGGQQYAIPAEPVHTFSPHLRSHSVSTPFVHQILDPFTQVFTNLFTILSTRSHFTVPRSPRLLTAVHS